MTSVNLPELSFSTNGLLPAIVQDHESGKVLMLAYMNKEAVQKTMETKETWFYSRSRKELWNKGATSGNKQYVKNIAFDCDSDALLISVTSAGPACHTGKVSCFYNIMYQEKQDDREVIHDINQIIQDRKEHPVDNSYTNYLFREGVDKVLKKIGEEASEVIIGAKNKDKEEIKWEVADLIYHTLVLMNMMDVSIGDIKEELYQRHIQKKEETNE